MYLKGGSLYSLKLPWRNEEIEKETTSKTMVQD
jgi:hypothetical protein